MIFHAAKKNASKRWKESTRKLKKTEGRKYPGPACRMGGPRGDVSKRRSRSRLKAAAGVADASEQRDAAAAATAEAAAMATTAAICPATGAALATAATMTTPPAHEATGAAVATANYHSRDCSRSRSRASTCRRFGGVSLQSVCRDNSSAA